MSVQSKDTSAGGVDKHKTTPPRCEVEDGDGTQADSSHSERQKKLNELTALRNRSLHRARTARRVLASERSAKQREEATKQREEAKVRKEEARRKLLELKEKQRETNRIGIMEKV